MIYATVRNRKIHVKKPDTVVQNGVNVDWLELDMDDEWKSMDSIVCVFALHYTEESTETTNDEDGGYTVTTVITEKEVQKEMLHTFGEPVLVPWECLEKTGMLSVNCTGYVDGEKVMTTAYPDSYWEVVQNGPMSGEETLEPTPSLYDQIMAAAGAATAAATAAEETRNQLLQDKANGVFDGKDGKSTTVTVGDTTTGSPGTSAQVYATGNEENMILNFTIPRGDPGPVPSTLPNPYPLFLDIDGVQVEYDGSQAVAAQVKRNEVNWGTAMMKQLQEHNESPNAHQDIREAIPATLPNPHALDLTINGVRVEYDGSEEVTAKIEVTGDAGGTSGTDVAQAINNHNDNASAHPAIRDMIPTVPKTLPNPQPLQIDYADEDGSLMSTVYTGDATITVSQKNLTAYPIAQHNQSAEAHQDIRAAIPTVPSALPNPKKLTFTGAVEAEYDGSAAVSVEIPAGGSGGGTDLSLGVIGATVGQVVKISAVDDSGKPTAWEAVDMESGGGTDNVWNIVTELTLDEEMAVELTVPEEAAGYTQWRAHLAVPKGETAASFTKYTIFFGASGVVNNMGAVSASYGHGVMVSGEWISGKERMVLQKTTADFANTPPGFFETPRTSWASPNQGIAAIEDPSVLFASKIALPAGTKLLFLGR